MVDEQLLKRMSYSPNPDFHFSSIAFVFRAVKACSPEPCITKYSAIHNNVIQINTIQAHITQINITEVHRGAAAVFPEYPHQCIFFLKG